MGHASLRSSLTVQLKLLIILSSPNMEMSNRCAAVSAKIPMAHLHLITSGDKLGTMALQSQGGSPQHQQQQHTKGVMCAGRALSFILIEQYGTRHKTSRDGAVTYNCMCQVSIL